MAAPPCLWLEPPRNPGRAAGRAWLDLREVNADEVFPSAMGEDILEDAGVAAAGAASGAPAGPLRTIVQAMSCNMYVSLSDSESPAREVSESEAEEPAASASSGSDAEVGDSRGAVSGALPSDLE